MAVYVGYGANVYLASGTPVSFTDEAMTNAGDNKTYTITNSAKRFWSRNYAVTVKKNGGVISSGFTIQYPGGRVVFTTANQPTDTITVSGYYIPVSQIGDGKEWTLDIESDTEDATTFGSQWKSFVVTRRGSSGSITHFWNDGSFLSQMASLMGFELRTDSSKKYQFYGYFTKDAVNTAADGLVEEPLDFIVDGNVYYG